MLYGGGLTHKFKVGDILERRPRAYEGWAKTILVIGLSVDFGTDKYEFIVVGTELRGKLTADIIEVDYKKVA